MIERGHIYDREESRRKIWWKMKRKKEEENPRFIDGGGSECSWSGRGLSRTALWEG